MHRVLIFLFSIILFFMPLYISDAANSKKPTQIIFEGTLLEKSHHSGIGCGVFLTWQEAKYKINKVIEGEIKDEIISVYYLACDGDVFQEIDVGSNVKVTLLSHSEVKKRIRERNPKDFVALDLPQKIDKER